MKWKMTILFTTENEDKAEEVCMEVDNLLNALPIGDLETFGPVKLE